MRACPATEGDWMKWLRFATALLGVLIVLFGAILLSGQGVLFAMIDAMEPVTPDNAGHGRIPAWRCHYVTAKGTFSFESSMAFGAEPCDLLKRPDASSWKFRRASFF
jgi:hypothetical protein